MTKKRAARDLAPICAPPRFCRELEQLSQPELADFVFWLGCLLNGGVDAQDDEVIADLRAIRRRVTRDRGNLQTSITMRGI